MRRRALLSAARTALLTTPLAALAGCSGFGSDATDSPNTAEQSPTDSPTPSPTPTPATVQTPGELPLAVAEHTMERSNEGSDSETVAVDAVVENTGDAAVTDVRVTARFVDEDGNSLDENSARTDRIGAGSRWEVELLYPGSGDAAAAVTDYRLIVDRDD